MNIYQLIAVVVGIAAVAAISFWNKILDWAHAHLFPWVEQHCKALAPYVREAFRWLDQHVAVPVRQAVKRAWQGIRQWLLKTTVHFEVLHGASEWTRLLKSYLIDPDTHTVTKVEVSEKVSWQELPDDIRAEFLRKQKSAADLNITDIRDQEVNEITVLN